jgi:exonuclease SbcC
MALSHPEDNGLLDRLRNRLGEEAFIGGPVDVWIPENTRNQLLLVKRAGDLAAFALSNGDPKQCYEDCYAEFKKMYSDNHSSWDSFNLAFVLCVRYREPELEGFYSSVETDTYFCRKFVISFEESIDAGLETLPFVPLERISGPFQRPPSARTLLQQRFGVPAKLAEYLIELGRGSKDRIVNDCLDGKFGEPNVQIEAEVMSGRDSIAPSEPVRLKALRIESFRAYHKPQEFDLDADIVVLYGPNGFGKTSFFDAVDFGATGEIGRLDLSGDDFKKAAANLGGSPQASSVTLVYGNQSQLHELSRTVANRGEAQLDGRIVSNKKTIAHLTGVNKPTGGEHIRNLIGLFRATHLFSQESQEFAEDFHTKCQLPAEVVSRMLAFEDYSSGNKKVNDVLDVIDGLISRKKIEADGIELALGEDLSRLKQLEAQSKPSEAPQALESLIDETRQKVREADIPVDTSVVDLEMLRGWRGLLESQSEERRSRIERLRALIPTVAEISVLKAQIPSRDADRKVKQEEIKESEAQQLELVRILEDKTKAVESLSGELQTSRERVEALAWFDQQKPVYDQLLAEKNAVSSEVEAIGNKRDERHRSVTTLGAEESTIETRIAENQQELIGNQKLLSKLREIEGRYADWGKNEIRITELEKSNATNVRSLTNIQKELAEAESVVSKAEAGKRQLQQEVERIEANQTELQNLLAALETFVTAPQCPLCGENHGTVEKLREQIELQRQASRRVTDAHAKLRDAHDKSERLRAGVAELTAKLTDNKANITSEVAELERLRSETLLFVEDATDAGFAATFELLDQLKTKEREIEELCRKLINDLSEQNVTRSLLANERNATQTQAAQLETDLAAKNERLTQIENNLARLKDDVTELQLPWQLSEQNVAELKATTVSQEDSLKSQFQFAVKEFEAAKSNATTGTQHLERLKNELLEIEVNLSVLQHKVSSCQIELDELSLESDTSAESLKETTENEARRVSALEDAIQATLNLEVALDAAETSARKAELRQSIELRQTSVDKLQADRLLEESWRKYFQEVRKGLEGEQALAVKRYTEQYGPRTSIIQRRLRTVYGFGDIVLKPFKDRIDVRVKRDNEELRPTDYFSESQKQILLLSIFLTASGTQTWSAFSPIFLDDPVTHFDDLNSYSFLDLLVGLVENDRCKRQFIFSTCEERLFQLARNRFRGFGSRAKFYHFKSIGRDGPVIETY